MNQHEKFKNAVANFEQAEVSAREAEMAAKLAGETRDSMRTKLTKTVHAVFGDRPVIYKGKRYSVVVLTDGPVLNITNAQEAIVED